MAYKLTSQTANGLPDRLVLFFPAKTIFVELKAPGKQLRPLQRKRRYQLMKLGFPVLCIDRFSQVQPCIEAITCYVDASHPSIAGIKTITAQYSGVIPLSYTLDDGQSYTDTTLQEFLNLDPTTLFSSLPESMQMTLIFTLQGDATITSFKITYIN